MVKRGRFKTQIFHLSNIIRRKWNSIDDIKADPRDWIINKKEISQHFLCKFKELFTKEMIDFPMDLEDLIQTFITEQENDQLCQIPSPEEIIDTLWNDCTKSSSLQGQMGYLLCSTRNTGPQLRKKKPRLSEDYFKREGYSKR